MKSDYTIALRRPDGTEHVWLVDDNPKSLVVVVQCLIRECTDGKRAEDVAKAALHALLELESEADPDEP